MQLSRQRPFPLRRAPPRLVCASDVPSAAEDTGEKAHFGSWRRPQPRPPRLVSRVGGREPGVLRADRTQPLRLRGAKPRPSRRRCRDPRRSRPSLRCRDRRGNAGLHPGARPAALLLAAAQATSFQSCVQQVLRHPLEPLRMRRGRSDLRQPGVVVRPWTGEPRRGGGVSLDQGAAAVLARRALGLRERVRPAVVAGCPGAQPTGRRRAWRCWRRCSRRGAPPGNHAGSAHVVSSR